ncbi:MAG TPA: enoyl-CoA hydratase/isomerase family protein [Deltaproteobacteria bacterium]|nr:enoyl-CoA hydratase/isomerase family protein [Deltaproteobacteria bacterium]
MADDVQLSVQGGVAFIQLNRPSTGNAILGPMFDSLRKIVLKLADAPPQFLVLSGEGADFCTGLELEAGDPLYGMLESMMSSRDAYRVQELITRLRGTFDAMGRLPCPIIAAIEGTCHGAGLELALIADLRIASDEATFALPGVRSGLLTGLGGLVQLSLLVGPARAAALTLTGSTLDASEAMSLGLVSRLCPPGMARAGALDLVAEMQRTSPTARRQTLLAHRAIRQKMAEGLFEHESQCAARTWISGEWQQGLSARRSGREPSW